jgi:hypothetical protein
MQDRTSCQLEEVLLQRTAGPYIGVKSAGGGPTRPSVYVRSTSKSRRKFQALGARPPAYATTTPRHHATLVSAAVAIVGVRDGAVVMWDIGCQ